MRVTAKGNASDNGTWMPARLIPVAGIRGQDEQEIRAASSLLAVMRAVDEFGKALLKEIGAPAGRISTFTEVPLETAEGKTLRPDGAITVERGKTSWKCLVEVKTGNVPLGGEQVSTYLDLAREHGFQAVLTISNQISGGATDVPVTVDGRKLRSVDLRHLSWWRILTEAIMQPAPRSPRSRPSLDSRRADRLLGARKVRCDRLRGHGTKLGEGSKCGSRWNHPSCRPRSTRCGGPLGTVRRVPLPHAEPRPRRSGFVGTVTSKGWAKVDRGSIQGPRDGRHPLWLLPCPPCSRSYRRRSRPSCSADPGQRQAERSQGGAVGDPHQLDASPVEKSPRRSADRSPFLEDERVDRTPSPRCP